MHGSSYSTARSFFCSAESGANAGSGSPTAKTVTSARAKAPSAVPSNETSFDPFATRSAAFVATMRSSGSPDSA